MARGEGIMESDVLPIDGRYGGGQVLRTSLALSILLNRPVHVQHIRAQRPRPGLREQHLASIRLAAAYAHAHVHHAGIESKDVLFIPRQERSQEISVTIPTAGSTMLALQSILPALILERGRKKITLLGGTDVPHAPSPDYIRDILLPLLTDYAIARIRILRRGYYPEGNGRIDMSIESAYTPSDMEAYPPLSSQCHEHLRLEGISLRATASIQLAEKRVLERLERYAQLRASSYGVTLASHIQYVQSSMGGGFTLSFQHAQGRIGLSVAFEKGKRIEEHAQEAFSELEDLLKEGCTLDDHAFDMLLPLLPFIGGRLCGRSTEHARAVLYVLSRFLPEGILHIQHGPNYLCVTVSQRILPASMPP